MHQYIIKKYLNNGKNTGISCGIFLLFLLLLPSTAQELSETSAELLFMCPHGPDKINCICTHNVVNCTEAGLLTVPTSLNTNVQHLILRNNYISSLDSITSKLPHSLVYIDAAFNLISFVDWLIFSSLTNLEDLHLQKNLIYSADLSYFHGTNLKVLNLSGNYLAQIIMNEGIESPLEKLDLSNNLLTTLPPTIFDGLNNLKVLNLAGNPWHCDCTLYWLKVFLVSFHTTGKTLKNKEQIQCISGTKSNSFIGLLDHSFYDCEDGMQFKRKERSLISGISPLNWAAKCSLLHNILLYPCPPKAASCVFTFLSQAYSFVEFLWETNGIMSKTKCRDLCQENNNSYFFYGNSDSSCLCGDTVNVPNCKECSSLTINSTTFCNNLYSNVGEAMSVVYDLTITLSPTLPQVMTIVNFSISGGASIFDTFFWNFSDATTRSVLNDKTASHTFIYPGQFDVTVHLTSSLLPSIQSQVTVRVTVVLTSDAGKLICPASVVSSSTKLNVSTIFTSSWNQKVRWVREYQSFNGQRRITEYEKKCEQSWTQFRNRCIKPIMTASNIVTAQSFCTGQGALLLRFYSDDEISELKSSSLIFPNSSDKHYFTGAEWSSSLEGYVWKSTSIRANVFREILPNAAIGNCVVLTIKGLQGVACSEQLPFVCEKDPVACTGSQQSVGKSCIVVASKPATWDQAQNACQSTYTNGKLVSILDSSDNQFISGLFTSKSWIGLRAWTARSYYTWQNGQALGSYTNWGSTINNEPCVSMDRSGMWQAESCDNQNSYVCKYFIGDEVNIPWLVVGPLSVNNDVATPVTSTIMAAPQILSSSQVTLLLGSWFSAPGQLLRWNIQVQSLTVDTTLSLQIWRPFCSTGTLIWPGCSNNRSQLPTCAKTLTSCSTSYICSDGQYLCMLTNTCLPVTKPCTCASIASVVSGIDCQNPTIDSVNSKYELIYMTTIRVPARATQIQFESSTEVLMQAGDVIGFQTESKDTRICDEPSTTEWRHLVITANTDYWMDVGDIVDPVAYQLKKDILCRINAVYTTMKAVLSPTTLSYVTSPGVYNLTTLTGSLQSQGCSFTVMDEIEGLLWVYPEASVKDSPGQGYLIYNVNVEAGISQSMTIKLLKGSNSTVTWIFNGRSGVTSPFFVDCPMLLKSPPDICNYHSSLLDLPYSSLSQVFPSGPSFTYVIVNVTNDISWLALHVNIHAYAAITLVEFYHDDCISKTACEVTVETGKVQTFHMSVRAGDMTMVVFYENGQVIKPTPSDTSVLSRTFQKSAVYVLKVNVSNSFSWKVTDLKVLSEVKAKFSNMLFINVLDKVAVNTLETILANVQVAIGANIKVLWMFNGEKFQYAIQANATVMSISFSYRFNTTGNVPVVLVLTDKFGDSITKSITIEVFKIVDVPLLVSTSNNYVATLQDFNLTVKVENGSLSDKDAYGILNFTVDWNDKSPVMRWSSPTLLQVLQHQYKQAGVFTISVTMVSAYNISKIQTGTAKIEAQDIITGLNLSYDGPFHFSKNITFTAAQQSGSKVKYSIDYGDNLTNTSFQSTPVFVYRYSVADVYRATLTARNFVSERTVKLVLYAYDENLLKIIRINTKNHVSLGKLVEINADVAAESPDKLFYDWSFGNGNIFSAVSGKWTETTYYNISTYNITLIVKKNYTSPTFDVMRREISVEEEISGLMVSYKTPIALRQPRGSVQANFHAFVTTGSNIFYSWTFDGLSIYPHQDTLNILPVTEARVYNVTLKADNHVSHQMVSLELTVIEIISGLEAHCQSCFSLYNARTKGNTTFNATVLYGTLVNYRWTFIESGELKTGKIVEYIFSKPQNYTVKLFAGNDISNESVTVIIIAQDEITGVSVTPTATIVEVNESVTFKMAFSSGTDVNIFWRCDTSSNLLNNNSTSLVYSFKSSGYHQCSVVISNAVSLVNKSSQVAVLDQITLLLIDQSLSVKAGSTNVFAAVGVEYTFTSQINTNFLVDLEWRAMNVISSTTIVGNDATFKYIFKSDGIYKMTLKAQNAVSSKETAIMVEAQEQISNVYIQSNKTLPLQVFIGESLLFHAIVATGSHLSYVWVLNGLILSTINNSVTLTFKSIGNFTVQVIVANDLETIPAMIQISVFTRVSNVAIRVKQNLKLPFVMRGTTIDLYSANISGTSLEYIWTVTNLSNGNINFTSSLKNISFLFNISGKYLVVLKVQNPVSSEEDRLTLEVQGAIIELKVTLQNSVVATGSNLTFMAETNPDATDVEYMWQIDGEFKQVPYFVKIFAKAGTYKIVIIAANDVSSVSKDNMVIRVQDAISNLKIKDCNLIRMVQVLIPLQAIVDMGTNVTFTWFIEINNQNKTFLGQYLNISLPTMGGYNIFLFAHNDISTKSTSCQLQAQMPISHVTLAVLDPSPNYIFQNQNVTFKATGTNIGSATFEWRVSSYSKVISKFNTYTTSIPVPGYYTLFLNVSNGVSQVQVALNFLVKAFLCQLPELFRVGAINRVIQMSQSLELEVAVNAKQCSAYIAVHKWTIIKNSDCFKNESLAQKVDIGDTATTSPSIIINSRVLAVGLYCVYFTTGYQYTSMSLSTFYFVNVTATKLKAIIKGGNIRTISTKTLMFFDGTLSFDPDNTSRHLTFTWTCMVVKAVGGCFNIFSNSTFYYNGFNVGQYKIMLQVEYSGKLADTTEQTINVLNLTDILPIASVVCESCLALNRFRVSASQYVTLSATCDNCKCDTEFLWKIFEEKKEIFPNSSHTSTGLLKSNLVLNKWGLLKDGLSYTFIVQVSCVNKKDNYGNASITLLPNLPPSNGKCSIYPSEIIPLQDQVTVNCSGWSDPDDNSTFLIYRILANSKDPFTNKNQQYVLYSGSSQTQSVYVSSFTGSSLEVKVMVGDKFDAFAVGGQSVIKFKSISLPGNMTMTDYLVIQTEVVLSSLIKQASPISLLQYAIALGQQLNAESQKEAEISGRGTMLEQTRAAVRDAVTICLSTVVPILTLDDVQQMALALRLLTDYFCEYLTEDSQRLLATTLQVIGTFLQKMVIKGLGSEDIPLNYLLPVIRNLLNAANARMYSSKSLWDSGRTVTINNFNTSFKDLRPEITEIIGGLEFTNINLNETHRKFVVSAIVPLLEDLLVSTLQTMVLGETSLSMDIRGMKIIASRSFVKDITLQFLSDKVQITIPSTILSSKMDALDEVFQVIIYHDRNPYTYGYSVSLSPQMPVPTVSFYEPKGSYIQVQSLADSARVGLCMLSSHGNVSGCYGLINGSTDANAMMNLNYKKVILAPNKSKKWKVPFMSSEVESGVGLHIQLRFSNLSKKNNSTNKTGLTAYLGINFVPSFKHYSHLLTLTPDLMENGVDHRNFTFFHNSLNPSDKVFVVVTNNNNESKVELLVGIYYSNCEYFNTVSQMWAHNGCQAQKQSTAATTYCKCNHLTSFGGTGIISLADIDFTDLDNLDIATNPVVFIAVTIIFVIYILVTILCYYLDRLDLNRISKIPLCGQVGSFLYEVTMVTGCQINAGTTAHVGIKLYGSSSKGAARHLTKPAAFQRNCRDTFIVAYHTNLGEITKMKVWHDNTGLSPSWFLSHILVKDLQTSDISTFLVNSWLSLDRENGVIQKKMNVSDESELKKFYTKFSNVFWGLMTDLHTWMSVSNKPDHSRFSRVQRCICCLTCVYLYMAVNAMWFGLFKNKTQVDAPLDFGWEDIVICLVSTLTVVPFIFGLSLIFKKSRCKASMFQEAQRPGSAQTLEIDALCTLSGDGSSYRAVTPLGDWMQALERESTTDSITQAPFGLKRTAPINRSKRKGSNESVASVKERSPIATIANQKNFWNKDSILKSWPHSTPHWPSKVKVSVENPSLAPIDDNSNTLPKPKSWITKNVHNSKSLNDGDEGILQLLDEADAVIPREEEKRKKRLALKARQASGDGLFDSDDEWTNEGIADVTTTTDIASNLQRKEAEHNPNLSRRLSHTNFTLPESTRKPDSAGGSKKERKPSLLQDQARTSIVSSSSKSKTIISGRLRSLSVVSQMSLQNSSGCLLPFWCVYIAYIICIILCVISVILILLYGYQFGADVAVKWIASLCITLLISILIIEPLKVLVLTVYRTTYSENNGEENSDMIDIKPQVESNEQFKDVKFRPLGGYALLQAKEEGKKKQKLYTMIQEVVVFTFMFGLFLAIVYINYNSKAMFQTTNNIESKFYSSFYQNGVNPHTLNITNLRSTPDFWQWTQTVMAKSLHYRELFPSENFGYLMGPTWMRQIRGEIVTCPVGLKTSSLFAPELVTRRCVDDGASDPYTSSYGVGWISGSANWTYLTGLQLNRFAKFGQSLLYKAGGYVQKLGLTYQTTMAKLQQLKADGWVDLQTRAVFIEFTLYSPSSDLTSCVTLLLEFLTTGGIMASSTVWTEHLLRFIPGYVDPIMVCQVMFFPFIVYVTVVAAKSLKSQKLMFFTNLWNWLDLFISILLWTNVGLYITCVAMATSAVKSYLADQIAPNEIEKAAMLHYVLRVVHACLMVLFIFKIVRQVRFFRPLYKIYQTLATAKGPLLGVFFIFIILLLTYAQFGFLLYGSTVYGYHSFQHCIMSLFGIMAGRTNFWPMFESQRVFTHLFFISFGLFAYGLVIALIVAVLTWSFRWSRSQMTYKTSLDARDYEMIDFMIKRFKFMIGMQKQKPLFRQVKFEGLPSLPSHSTSSTVSHRSCIVSPVPMFPGTAPLDTVQQYLKNCIDNMQPAWNQVVKTVQRIEELDDQDEDKLQKLILQLIKLSPENKKLKQLKHNLTLQNSNSNQATTISKSTSHYSVKDATSLASRSRIAPQTFSISDVPVVQSSGPSETEFKVQWSRIQSSQGQSSGVSETSVRKLPSAHKNKYEPKLNNDSILPKKKLFQFGHQIKPAPVVSNSAEQRTNMAYGFSASHSNRLAGSNIQDKRAFYEQALSAIDGSPIKHKRVWRTDI